MDNRPMRRSACGRRCVRAPVLPRARVDGHNQEGAAERPQAADVAELLPLDAPREDPEPDEPDPEPDDPEPDEPDDPDGDPDADDPDVPDPDDPEPDEDPPAAAFPDAPPSPGDFAPAPARLSVR